MKKPKNYLKRSSRVKLSGFYFRKQTGTDFRPEIRGSLSGNPDTEKLKKVMLSAIPESTVDMLMTSFPIKTAFPRQSAFVMPGSLFLF